MSAQKPAQWHAAEWARHAATTVLVDDATVVTGKRVIAECDTVAHARLIARAPAMLATLFKAHKFISTDCQHFIDSAIKPDGTYEPDNQLVIDDYAEVLREIGAVINEATT